MAGSRFTTTEHGEQFAMTSGLSVLPVLCAVNSVSPVPCRLFAVQHTVKVWILLGLTMSNVREERSLCLIVHIEDGK